MKKVILMTLALVLILSCAGLVACGSSGTAGSITAALKTTVGLMPTAKTISQTTTSAAKTTSQTTTAVSSGGGTWLDIPLYPGAKLLMEQSANNPNDKYAKEMHRIYQSTDSASKVTAFYKSGMPANGWTELLWSESSVFVTAQFNKNDQKDFASVTLSSSGDTTTISLVRDY